MPLPHSLDTSRFESHNLLLVSANVIPHDSNRAELVIFGALLIALILPLVIRQRIRSADSRQITKVSTYLARLNQMANEVSGRRDLLSQACELAVTVGGFRFAAVREASDAVASMSTFETICQTGRGDERLLEQIEPLIRRALLADEPLFTKLNMNYSKTLSTTSSPRLKKRRPVVILPLNFYFKNQTVLVLAPGDGGDRLLANQLVRELVTEIANDLMRASHRIELIKRDLEISAINESLLGSLGVGINVVRYPDRVIEIANERILEIAGAKDLDEFMGTLARDFYVSDAEFQRVGEFAKFVQSSGYGKLDRVAFRRLSGEPVFLDMSGRLLDLGDGAVRIVWTQIDVTDRVEADRQRNHLSHLRDVLLNNTIAGIDLVEYPDRRIIEANHAFAEMLGYDDVSEVIGLKTAVLYTVQSENDRMLSLVQRIFSNGEGGIRDLQAVKKDGSSIYLDIHGRLLQGDDSDKQVIVWTSVDVTERHHLNDELRRNANFDALTNLPNRRAFNFYLDAALSRVRDNGNYLAVGVIDLDDFKPVNDAYGHPAGDELLKEFANRLRAALRGGDFASRLGGDEFIVILEGMSLATIETQLESVLSRLHKTVESPFLLNDSVLVNVGMSMGIAFSSGGNEEPDTLVRQADAAMYAIKKLKGTRKQWWMIAESELEDVLEPFALDSSGDNLSKLLGTLSEFVAPRIGQFIDRVFEVLIGHGSISKNFSEIPHDYLDEVRSLQRHDLEVLLSSTVEVVQLRECSERLGAIHAYIGTSSSGLVEIINLYRDFIYEALEATSIRSIDRLLLQSAIEERLQLDLQLQLESMDRSIDNYSAILSDKSLTSGRSWIEAMRQEVVALSRLPGILGCQLWKQNLEGVFYPEINEGVIRDSIELIVATSNTPRLDTRVRTGTGMVPVALLTGVIATSNAFGNDPRTAPWHDLLVPRGVRSIVAIPITNQNSPGGVVVLHGRYPNQFSSKWITSFLAELKLQLASTLRSYDENSPRISGGRVEEHRKLLYSGSLVMFGQPIVEVVDGTVVKVEMLARMVRGDGSIATPADFMAEFSEADLDTLFIQGLDQALRQIKEWDGQGFFVNVSLNIAPSTVMNPQASRWIRDHLETYGVDPARLTLELVENQEMAGDHHAQAVRLLSEIGVLLAIDDLGSGYSSLKRLASLPFDVIKIDQSIVRALRYDPLSNLSLIRTMIQIGADFDRHVIVEGVESEAEIDAVRRLGAKFVQGYAVARPMPLGDIMSWATSGRWRPSDSTVVTSLLEALAFHMSLPLLDGLAAGVDLGDCLVTHLIELKKLHHTEANFWHSMIHEDQIDSETKRGYTKMFMSWIADEIRKEGP